MKGGMGNMDIVTGRAEAAPGRQMDEWVKALFAKYCKPLGYKKEGINFRLIQSDGLGKVINFQRSHNNTAQCCSFTINAGIYFEKETVLEYPKFKEYQCLLRNRPRLSDLDPWWTIEEGKSVDEVWAAVEKTFAQAVLPWLAKYPAKSKTVKMIIADLMESSIPQPLYVANRLIDCGYGALLLPYLKTEHTEWQGWGRGLEAERLIKMIESSTIR